MNESDQELSQQAEDLLSQDVLNNILSDKEDAAAFLKASQRAFKESEGRLSREERIIEEGVRLLREGKSLNQVKHL